MKDFNRENWDAANERLTYFLRELADDGYPDDLIADVTMDSGGGSHRRSLRPRGACPAPMPTRADGDRPESRHGHRSQVLAMRLRGRDPKSRE